MSKKKIIIGVGILALGYFFVNTYTAAPGYGTEEMQEEFFKHNKTCYGLSFTIPNPIEDAASRAVCVGLLK